LKNSKEIAILWSNYMMYRLELRGFNQKQVEKILRYSVERYYDVETQRMVVIGRHDDRLVMIPYEQKINTVTPVTIHSISRQLIKLRLKSRRFTNE